METIQYLYDNTTEDDRKFVSEKLFQYNLDKLQLKDYTKSENIYIVAKNEAGERTGGIFATFFWKDVSFLHLLWVHEKYRGQNIGSQLLHKLETALIERECKLLHLDTFDFQAPEFYKKKGYEVFGELKDCPAGHTRYYFCKRFA